jgi:hypothetical protein
MFRPQPKYITKYIVENTIGKLCEEKRKELNIIDEEYAKGRKNRKRNTISILDNKLTDYRNWLLSLKILDPACGSGAFLNQALDFLIVEHRKIDELKSQLAKKEDNAYALIHSDYSIEILENNLYGVDINDESIEIAKLSLWLRTAQKGRKLNKLSNNLKCGNSLIDDPEIAGGKAFNWQYEFPEVFAKGGFDVVIGNPPYGAELPLHQKEYLESKYDTFEYQVNTYVLFYERGLWITRDHGILGYITPATFTYQYYFKKLREYMQGYTQIAICKYFYEVFEDADIGDSVSWIIQKSENTRKDILFQLCKLKEDSMKFPSFMPYSSLVNESDNSYNLSLGCLELTKFYKNSKPLIDIANIIVGIKAYQTGKGVPKQTKEIVDNKTFTSDKKIDKTFLKCVIGKDFHRYRFLQEPTMYLSYGKWLAEPRESAPFFEREKIILRQTSDSLICHIDNCKRINLNNVYNIGNIDPDYNIKYLLGLMNSKLLNYIYQNISQEKGRTFAEVKKIYLAKLPIKICDVILQNKVVKLVESILEKNETANSLINSFISLLQSKLINWYNHDFSGFIKELNSIKIKLSLTDESEWMLYFNEHKEMVQNLKSEIEYAERQVDYIVYELYGLNEDDIKIVEGNCNEY